MWWSGRRHFFVRETTFLIGQCGLPPVGRRKPGVTVFCFHLYMLSWYQLCPRWFHTPFIAVNAYLAGASSFFNDPMKVLVLTACKCHLKLSACQLGEQGETELIAFYLINNKVTKYNTLHEVLILMSAGCERIIQFTCYKIILGQNRDVSHNFRLEKSHKTRGFSSKNTPAII